MGYYYRLVCKEHNESIPLAKDNGQIDLDGELFMEFKVRHIYKDCQVVVMGEIDYDCMPCLHIENGRLLIDGLIIDSHGQYQKYHQELERAYK
jgi:hypothetical protein